jgi:ABC-2 type transport system ATP-binding protein
VRRSCPGARGKTVILSSHLLADVEDVCDRVVIYYGAKCGQHIEELLAAPDAMQISAPLCRAKRFILN